jgi:low affinity Fe/Cu permease
VGHSERVVRGLFGVRGAISIRWLFGGCLVVVWRFIGKLWRFISSDCTLYWGVAVTVVGFVCVVDQEIC